MGKSRTQLFRTAVIAAAGLLFGLSAPVFAANTANPIEGIKLVQPGTLTICTHLPYKPFEFVDEKGNAVGFDVDLANLLAKKLKVGTKIISIDWNQIVSGLVFAAHKCDIAMGGATITAKRAAAVLYTAPYFSSAQALLAKKDSGIKGLADLKGKRLGVQTSTTGKIYAKNHADQYGYTLVDFQDLALLTTAVSAGSVAASIDDYGPFAVYAKAHPETAVVTVFPTGEHLAFMVQKDTTNGRRLANLFNIALVEARNDGTYAKLYQKWFGKVPVRGGAE